MRRIDLKHNSDCRYRRAEDENPEYLISKCTTIAVIRVSHFGKAITDEGEMPFLKASQLLQFLKTLNLTSKFL